MRFLYISFFAAIVGSQALISTSWLEGSLPGNEEIPYDIAYNPSAGTRCTVNPVGMWLSSQLFMLTFVNRRKANNSYIMGSVSPVATVITICPCGAKVSTLITTLRRGFPIVRKPSKSFPKVSRKATRFYSVYIADCGGLDRHEAASVLHYSTVLH